MEEHLYRFFGDATKRQMSKHDSFLAHTILLITFDHLRLFLLFSHRVFGLIVVHLLHQHLLVCSKFEIN